MKLPELQVKTQKVTLGGHEIEIRGVKLKDQDLLLQLEEKDTAKTIKTMVELIARCIVSDDTDEEKLAFVNNLDAKEIPNIEKVANAIVAISDLGTGTSVEGDKKK